MWSDAEPLESVDDNDLLGHTRHPIYSSARSQIMGSSDMTSLPEISFLEDHRSWGVVLHYYSSLKSICLTNTGKADRWWTWTRSCWHEGKRGAILVDALVVALVPRTDEEVLEDDEKALWFIATTAKREELALWFIATSAKRQAIQSSSAPSERETNERCTRLCHYSKWRAVTSVRAVPDIPASTEYPQSFFLCHSRSNV